MAVRTLAWQGGDPPALRLLDQTRLPETEAYLDARTNDDVIGAIQRLSVRGAPALGATGAYGVGIILVQAEREGWDTGRVKSEIDRLHDARPTAVNLAWGVDRVRSLVADGLDAVLAEAHRIAAEDEAANHQLSRLGADWVIRRVGDRPLTVLTHCNTGSLATTAWGTALGIVRELHARRRLERVHVNETRPLLQGARLTSWELQQDGIEHAVQVDSAAAGLILRHGVDAVLIGADRITANGDTVNKVGSVGLALACAEAGVPFVVAAPWSTVDLSTPDGAAVEIEQRAEEEVLSFNGSPTTGRGATGYNPAFDVTPRHLIDLIVTERGAVEPTPGDDDPFAEAMA